MKPDLSNPVPDLDEYVTFNYWEGLWQVTGWLKLKDKYFYCRREEATHLVIYCEETKTGYVAAELSEVTRLNSYNENSNRSFSLAVSESFAGQSPEKIGFFGINKHFKYGYRNLTDAWEPQINENDSCW
jgi:hypothetical protein